ncbi:hypothetical protein FOA52_013960 [Chlamydomonas sp. UWO 241]|nr:hypothetical protein FOA52_013960 [Chlamydomonas sp. UWO 241]
MSSTSPLLPASGIALAKRRRGELLWDRVVIPLGCLALVAWLSWCYVYAFPVEFWEVTCTTDQPLYSRHESYFPDQEFASMRSTLLKSDLMLVKNALNGNNFGHTRGVVMSFNEEGLEELREVGRRRADIAAMLKLFDAVRVPRANAGVINVLRARPIEDLDWADAQWKHAGFAVKPQGAGEHVDNTLRRVERWGERVYLAAYQTSVLYLQVPEDIKGGGFVLNASSVSSVPEEGTITLDPKEGTVVSFRGDTWHSVEQFSTATGLPRVSLVVEQYKVRKELYGTVTKLWTSAPL